MEHRAPIARCAVDAASTVINGSPDAGDESTPNRLPSSNYLKK
jgi:hypothetical protein